MILFPEMRTPETVTPEPVACEIELNNVKTTKKEGNKR